ncbi:NAD-dependent epimerase/dehydratase family protein [Pectinatus haikarae]|uniref:Nucleoside-diphosphate-sugar epimerase n=1 Tax=Pectinatus haikarae TaxID=349096 RepID=A0ABT9YB50_9FIRM|nr:NAD-dependent epimerase/dehydratase family protein [Pectinatus haikarae]MDQ0205057.1 nucleoside-diphosphate-sugar epimerase [Pectinatus haikarae]
MNKYFMGSAIIERDMQDIYQRNIDWSNFNNQTVLITGATGMLASYIVYFFIYLNEIHNANIDILALVRNQAKCHQRFGSYAAKKYFQILNDDFTEPIKIKRKVDFIIHAASLASPQYYKLTPIEVAEPNAIGTYYLLQFAQKQQVRGFLFFSTGDIYGYIPSSNSITEDTAGSMDPLDLHSCYGESKRMGETWCATFASERKVPSHIVRIGHTYGPTMDIENDPRVFAAFMKCIYYGKDIIMLSNGTAKRSFCYIADAIAGFLLVLLEGEVGAAYNVCNSREFLSISELAELMVRLRPELNLKVIQKQRIDSESYLENKNNKANKLTEEKLMTLGWECHYDSYMGFCSVLKYLQGV